MSEANLQGRDGGSELPPPAAPKVDRAAHVERRAGQTWKHAEIEAPFRLAYRDDHRGMEAWTCDDGRRIYFGPTEMRSQTLLAAAPAPQVAAWLGHAFESTPGVETLCGHLCDDDAYCAASRLEHGAASQAAHPAERCSGLGCDVCRTWANDWVPRPVGCQCHLETGDSPCVIHGDENPPQAAPQLPGDDAKATVAKLVAEWETLKLLPQNLRGTLVATLHDAYAAGRAAGAREEREAIEDQLRTQADEHEHAADAYPVIAYEQSLRAECLRDEADVITKRGKAQ